MIKATPNMELAFIEQLRRGLAGSKTANELVRLGIGDDAAILDTRNLETVLTVDLLTEGVDFLLDEVEPQLIGRKALAVNLSDLAAVEAAVPVTVALPKRPPPLSELVRLVAVLGGYVHRENRRDPPDVETLWKGLQRLCDLAWIREPSAQPPIVTCVVQRGVSRGI